MAADGKGMTWGFVMFSDIIGNPGQRGVVKLGCNSSVAVQGQGPQMCDAYRGETACTEERYILCVAEPNNPYFQRLPPYNDPNSTNPATPYFPNLIIPPYKRPRYKIHHAAHAMPKKFYAGWVNQPIKLTRYKYAGNALTSAAVGNQLCGNGWRMAEFHDGRWMAGMDYNVPSTYGNGWNPQATKSGGWSFHAPLAPNRNMGTDEHPANAGNNADTKFINNRYWVRSNTTAANCWNP